MSHVAAGAVLDAVTDFLAKGLSYEELIDWHLPRDLQTRVDELVERNGEGQLTFDEQQELYDFLRADEMVALLKTKTRLKRLKGGQ